MVIIKSEANFFPPFLRSETEQREEKEARRYIKRGIIMRKEGL
jgi:hypothetical protein